MKNKTLIILLLLFVSKGFAVDSIQASSSISSAEKRKELKKDYANDRNPFLKALKYREELESAQAELKQLKKALRKSIRFGNTQQVQELDDEKQILESKLEILQEKHQRIYTKITKITTNNEPFNFMNFFSKKPLRDAENAINSLIALRLSYDQAKEQLELFSKKVKDLVKDSNDPKIKASYKTLLGSVLQDQRYLNGFKDLLDKQYEHLLEQRTSTELRYFEYRDSEILKHAVSIVVILLLFIIVYIGHKLTMRFIHEDERQFIYRRTISTSAIVTGLVFIMITYSENIIYALTLFTFIGAAIVIATRTFLINIIAWMNIILSKFIKVGDRVLIPHETKYYYGDIINISPVRITIYEAYDFSSTRMAVNAGRIIFIPNNYTFSHGVINYSHQGQKSIFDHLAFNLSFESDLTKAEAVTREVITQQTSQYLADAKEEFGKLKKRYAVKQRMLEPEIQFTVNAAGTSVKMTAWYITPSSQATSVKSKLLNALLVRFNEEPTIGFSRIKAKDEKEPIESGGEE